MNQTYAHIISGETGLREKFVEQTLHLLDEGATLPFISRYRKEQTGGMDEVEVGRVNDLRLRLQETAKRKQTILAAIESQGKLTDDLRQRIGQTWDAALLEDLYLPYKQKRRTRAQMARERGLEPLADWLLRQFPDSVEQRAQRFVNPTLGVNDGAEALAGAMDIVAERVSEDERSRQTVRAAFRRQASVRCRVVKGKEEEGQKFRDYFDWSEPLRRCPAHRLLAMRRGEAEGFLRLDISIAGEDTVERLLRQWVRGRSEAAERVAEAVHDGYRRLLEPSISTEFATLAKERADEEAILIFRRNLEQLLLAAPLGGRAVLAIDPGFRTGCKVVCLGSGGELLHSEALFPHPPRNERERATRRLLQLIQRHRPEAIAIGNGTAGRETEEWVRQAAPAMEVHVVSEDGASIYSASAVAREEFPEQDVTVRGAVSIGRRLMDPLAELVKIDASSLGVGQYQKDVNQTLLRQALEQTVERCVNRVGVNLNTASRHLLTRISGLGPALAQNIVNYRTENGPFRTRRDLMKVPRMGAKAFEQCAGFLRVEGGPQPLDNSAVHPERYALVERMAKDLGCKVDTLLADSAQRSRIQVEQYVSPEVGLPTLTDILQELEKPSRDPRQPIEAFRFDESVHTMADLRPGQVLPGIVTNVTRFGAFVDVGVHEKGLIHVSQLANRFVSDPSEVVSLHQHVRVEVLEVDLARKRFALRRHIS